MQVAEHEGAVFHFKHTETKLMKYPVNDYMI